MSYQVTNQFPFMIFDKTTIIFDICSECDSDDDCTAPQVCLDATDAAPNTCAICNAAADCDAASHSCHSDGTTGCIGKTYTVYSPHILDKIWLMFGDLVIYLCSPKT